MTDIIGRCLQQMKGTYHADTRTMPRLRQQPTASILRYRRSRGSGLHLPKPLAMRPFPPDVKSIDAAFADHLRTAHRPGQTSEDFSQAAARVVREATENK